MEYTTNNSDLESPLLDAPACEAKTTAETDETNEHNDYNGRRAFITKCFLVHLVLLFIQFYMDLRGPLTSFCSDKMVYYGLIAFGVSSFLYRDAYYTYKLSINNIMLMLPELLSTVILVCNVTGHAHWGVRILLTSAGIMAVSKIGLTGLQWARKTKTKQTSPSTESPELQKMTTVMVV
mmetsp:Transcript_8317/g.16093  ORF Transcript_8317/g.16093 Transcript_8317/m.16093 type:complete len:179 (+) Transcript_8317:159-695(+)